MPLTCMNHKSGWWLFSKNSLYSTYTPVDQNDDQTVRRGHFKHDLDDIEQQYSGSDSDDNENTNNAEMKHGVADIATMEESYEELVGSKQKTNYKKIGLITAGVLVVAAIIAVIVVFTTQGQPEPEPVSEQSITLEDFLEGNLYAQKSNATWISDKELMYKDLIGNIVIYNVESKTESILIGIENQGVIESFTYELSPDKSFILVSRNIQRLFRHSNVALYDAIDIATKSEHPISINTTQDYLFLAKWAPAGNGLVFVQGNNIYYKSSVLADPVQITTDGSRAIHYGTCDWVYEEEVFSANSAVWFSPDGSKLAYIRFDDRNVHLMNIPIYGTPGTIDSQYTQSIGIHYPKVGSPNPIVTLFTVDLSTLVAGQPAVSQPLLAPIEIRNADHIISAVGWQNSNTLASSWMNRVQNRAYIQACTGSLCQVFKTISSPTGWVELFKTLQFNSAGTQMVMIASQEQGTFGGYRHLTLVSTVNGAETPLTSGRFVVQDILKWDETTNQIFYSANTAEDSQVHHVYVVKAAAGAISQCLTCNFEQNGVKQTYFTAEFSKTGNNVVLITEGPSIPRVDIYSWSVDTADLVVLKHEFVYEENTKLRSKLGETALPNVVYLSVPLSSGFEAKVKLQLPPNADLTGSVRYPMLVDVYAGPDSYNGNDRFDLGWGSYLASNKSVIFAQINGRGSGLRGDRLMHAIYHKFGTVEIEDQIETAKKLSEILSYVDGTRTAIWGWSYGGYSAAMALAKDNSGVFKCAASVAPVTDWTYYDSIYTERYMGLPTPEDNANGYFMSRLSTIPDDFKNKTFYLIHGTMDDNVHYQQSMALARSLETHDVLFKQMSYPDEDHSLWSVRKHLYHSLGRYFAECFGLDKDL